MTDHIDPMQHLDEPEEDGPVIQEQPKKRTQPAWNALRRTLPEAEKRVVRQPVSPGWMQKPLAPPHRRAKA